MRAIQISEFGGPDVMKLVEIADPTDSGTVGGGEGEREGGY